jgi:AraC-like DNA-binding protein
MDAPAEPANAITLSTSDVDDVDAAAYWRDLICATFVEVAVRPAGGDGVNGVVRHKDVAGVGFTRVSSNAQLVDRTRGFVARSQQHHLLVNIQLQGNGLLAQDGRSAVLEPGSLVFVNSARPYMMRFDGDFEQLVVRFPMDLAPRRNLREATSVPLPASGPGRLVTDFLLGLDGEDPAVVQQLVPHAVGLLDTALGWAARHTAGSPLAITRECVHRFVREHGCDQDLDADAVAAGCRISRRTMFRALADDEPFTALVRRVRVGRAQQVLRSNPMLPLAAVAQQCGFTGAAQLHRAFQRVLGATPGEYRAG